MGFIFRTFHVVSPKYVVVLTKSTVVLEPMKSLKFRKSWFEEFDVDPEVVYSKKGAKGAEDFSPGDMFKFQRIVIPRKKVWLVNSFCLYSGENCVSFRSNPSMYKTLVFYKKNKKKLISNGPDFSALKRKLIADMNRTHST